jgi:hypothetical protein
MSLGLARDDSITAAIRADEMELACHMRYAVTSAELRAAILALREEDAVEFMDSLQEVFRENPFARVGIDSVLSCLISPGPIVI